MRFQSILAFAGLAATAHAVTIIELLRSKPNLSTLLDLVNGDSSLVDTLTKTPNITVFAPTNDAFSALFSAQPEIANDRELVTGILTYHVLGRLVPARRFNQTDDFVTTLLKDGKYTGVSDGQVVKTQVVLGKVVVTSGGGATSNVIAADAAFENGVLHTIDSVLTIPADLSTTAAAAGLTAVVDALAQAELLDTVNNLQGSTIFAPTNQAFAALPALPQGQELFNLMTYHYSDEGIFYSNQFENGQLFEVVYESELTIGVAANGSITVNDANLTDADILIKTGVLHVIDRVLEPPPL